MFKEIVDSFLTDPTIALLIIWGVSVTILLAIVSFFAFRSRKAQFGKGKRLVTAGEVFLIILFLIVGVCVAVWFASYVNNPKETTNMDQGRYIMDFVALLLVALSVGGGILAFYTRKKLERLDDFEDKIKSSRKMVLISAEIVLVNLPENIETQHIPLKAVRILEQIDRIVYQDETLYKTLDESGNGAKLRLAVGLGKYATGEYEDAKKVLAEAVKYSYPQDEVWPSAQLRRAMIFRQEGNYSESINILNKILNRCQSRDKLFHSYVNKAICHLLNAKDASLTLKKRVRELNSAWISLLDAPEHMVMGQDPWIEMDLMRYYLARFLNSTNILSQDHNFSDSISEDINNKITKSRQNKKTGVLWPQEKDVAIEKSPSSYIKYFTKISENLASTVSKRYRFNDGKGKINYEKISGVCEDHGIISNYCQALLICLSFSENGYNSVELFESAKKQTIDHALEVERQGGYSIFSDFEFKEIETKKYIQEMEKLSILRGWADKIRKNIV